ncbi:hypothetical protein [Actinomadura napierensis]|uniref:Uncharacterized protein n=1 Tax=Actinomadura napierensis TaxID=267854 RepID=A0ABN3AC70_9ACTN
MLFLDASDGAPGTAHRGGGAAVLTSAVKASGAGVGATVPWWLLGTVAALSLLVPCAGFLAADLTRKGAHARPLTGVALAIDVGLLTGTAELMLKGAAAQFPHPCTPAIAVYLALFAVTAPLALGQLQIALQRSRLVVTGLVATATAKTYLLLVGTLLFREPWPDGATAEIAAALTLSVLAIAAVPHHERSAARTRIHHLPSRATPGATGMIRKCGSGLQPVLRLARCSEHRSIGYGPERCALPLARPRRVPMTTWRGPRCAGRVQSLGLASTTSACADCPSRPAES